MSHEPLTDRKKLCRTASCLVRNEVYLYYIAIRKIKYLQDEVQSEEKIQRL